MSTSYICKVDRSPDTGTLVSCTCGATRGPFQDHSMARLVAKGHRERHKYERRQERKEQQARERQRPVANPAT